ncbi:MAG: neutral/alkaline non-lysosomal ceramidase N-terminal domain-containing protein [Candidatus Hydrogenedentota bacterium]
MRLFRRILLGVFLAVAALAVLFLVFVGPWPTYSTLDFEQAGYYEEALDAAETRLAESALGAPGALAAGWDAASITPATGTPLAGFSNRFNLTPGNLLLGKHEGDKVSTGVRDPLYAKALALSDGDDTVVLVGADMLLVPPNVAEEVRTRVEAQTGLTENDLLFGASHTHCGPGGWGPGVASRITGGEYDEAVVTLLADAFTRAIIGAHDALEPARMVHDSVDASEYIKNRARKGPVDGELSYLHVVQDDGDACFLTSFSAHPAYGSDMLEFTSDYPGALQRTLAEAADAEVVYLGGALGSMSARAPAAATDAARVEAMGEALAKLILADIQGAAAADYIRELDIASVGLPLDMPSLQVRPVSPKWRVSPLLRHVATLPAEGWLQGVRVGDVFFVALPFDFSGEISAEWKDWAANQGYDLWTTSFNSAYCGYLSPDKYYLEEPLNYETGLMAWFGPENEAYFTALFQHLFGLMTDAEEAA